MMIGVFDIQEIELLEIFFIQGIVHSIHLVTDKATRKYKGFGFIEMTDEAGADRAVASLNRTTIRGRKIIVKLAD
ncbi:RNA recognition motif [compost metagenome]